MEFLIPTIDKLKTLVLMKRSNAMHVCMVVLSVAVLILTSHSVAVAQDEIKAGNQKTDPAERWEKEISKFEASDKKNPVKPGGVLFLGSSSIRMWKLQQSFPNKRYLNRGFGGSEISDSIYFFDRLVRPYMPAKIVFYAGDNDISNKKSPETVLEDFKKFVKKTEEILPSTKIIFVAIKPSLSRWKLVGKMRKANQLIAEFASENPNVVFADIDTPMIGKDKMPIKELFVADGLHMSGKGYEIWTSVISPLLD